MSVEDGVSLDLPQPDGSPLQVLVQHVQLGDLLPGWDCVRIGRSCTCSVRVTHVEIKLVLGGERLLHTILSVGFYHLLFKSNFISFLDWIVESSVIFIFVFNKHLVQLRDSLVLRLGKEEP